MLHTRRNGSAGLAPLFCAAVALILLLGSIADFLAGSPGDGAALMAASIATLFGALILWPVGSLDRIRSTLWDKRAVAFGLFGFSAAAIFAKITEDVVERESPMLDRAVSLWVHSFDNPTIDAAMRGVSTVGGFWIIACLAIAVSIWAVSRRDFPAVAALLGVIAVDEITKELLKNVFARARPDLWTGIVPLDSYSFPSGHAMAAVARTGMIAVVVGRLAPSLKPWAYGLAAIFALVVGYSRVYLGAHWFTDVLGGYAAGAALLSIGVLWLERNPPPAASDSFDLSV